MDNPVVRMSADDSLKAIEIVRSRAAEWRIDPARVGIMGFSAGAWAAVMTGIERNAATRPNLMAAISPCCFNANNALSATNLRVPNDAPPLFLTHAYDDPIAVAAQVFLVSETDLSAQRSTGAEQTRTSAAQVLTAADCTVEKFGQDVAASAIGEPVRSVTLSPPSWAAAE